MRQQTLDEVSSDVVCPTCGDSFASERGVKIHHTMSHGESIAGVTVECEWCGTEKAVTPCRSERYENHFCDDDCRGEWLSENITAGSHPRWASVSVTCSWCGAERVARASTVERNDDHFCDHECYGEWLSENNVGDDHPGWKGGWQSYYGESWERQRRRAIERDGEKCVRCGLLRSIHRAANGRDLHVHHKVPFRVFGVENHERANQLENLITVCQSCHHAIEGLHAEGAEPDSGAAD